MLFWFIPLVVFIGMLVYLGWYEGEWGAAIAFGSVLALLSVLVVMLAGLLFTQFMPQDIVDTDTHEVHALVDNVQCEGQVSGNVFLVRAYVKEELKYNYMYEVEGKGFAFNSVKANQCFLNKTNDTPHVVINHYCCTNKVVNFLFGPCWNCHYEYIFYLPESAEIIDDFTIDLE